MVKAKINNEDKEAIKQLIASGDTIGATSYVRDRFGLSVKDSYKLVITLKKDIKPDPTISVKHIRRNTLVNNNKIFIIVFMGIGLGFLIAAISLFMYKKSFLNKSEKITGIIIDQRRSEDGDWAPIVQYQVRNTDYLYTSFYWRGDPYEINETITLFVNPENPEQASIDSFMELWFLSLLFGIFGLIFSGVGAVFIVSALKKT